MYIVIYRRHNELNCETKHYGPFAEHWEAYDFLCDLPGLGTYDEDSNIPNQGVRYIVELLSA